MQSGNFPPDESGYEAWLRYLRLTDDCGHSLRCLATHNLLGESNQMVESIVSEWNRALSGMRGEQVSLQRVDTESADLNFVEDLSLPEQAYSVSSDEHGLRVAASSPIGWLYGTFAALRKLQTGTDFTDLNEQSQPYIPLRMLNHWDNLIEDPVMGSIERVKGGKTIFDWTDLSRPNPRYEDYARLLASIGINGLCINNVNATAEILAPHMVQGIASLASVFRRWGIRIWISIDFSSPVELGGLPTADPCDARVQHWWADTVAQVYANIPDFGGFVVKADSEGRPGPGDYGRSHIEGSDCLAKALAPFGGVLFWRAFVYGRDISKRTPSKAAAGDRANHASYEFMHLDGQFAANVILQIKCSATDFQIWEPPHALFAKMQRTRLALEFQLAPEYTGQDIQLAWPGPYFERILNFDVSSDQSGTCIADVIAGRSGHGLSGAITAVAHTNNSRNWFGHLLGGAGLFALGRLAWDPSLKPSAVSAEYAALLFGTAAAPAVASLLDCSYHAQAQYTCPLGAGFLYESLHHVDPDPWSNQGTAGITDTGIGRDRTSVTGSGYLSLYPEHQAVRFADPSSCPLEYLLYFHHLPWSHCLPDGRTVIQTIYDSCYEGVEQVRAFKQQWRNLHGIIDLARWAHVYEKLGLQEEHAERWRDLLCRFFIEKSGVSDARDRFDLRSPSPHARIRSGFPLAVEDYRARVQRLRAQIGARTEEQVEFT